MSTENDTYAEVFRIMNREGLEAFAEEYAALRVIADRYATALASRPRDLDAAITRLYACETEYEVLAGRAADALDAWADADLIKARVKNQSVEKLIGGGMSRSAAEKAASDHEDYTAHRDKLAALEKTKRETEEARDIAKTRLYNARTVVEAYSAYSRPITYIQPPVMEGGEAAELAASIVKEMHKRRSVQITLDDPYENPSKLTPARPERGTRGPKAPSELPKVPPSATLAIKESLLTEFSVQETASDYVINGRRVERDDSLPSLVYSVRGLIPSRVMAGRWPEHGVIIVSRAAIGNPDEAFVEVLAAHSGGYSETIHIPITSRLCEICGERGGFERNYAGVRSYLCDDCDVNATGAAIDADRSAPVV